MRQHPLVTGRNFAEKVPYCTGTSFHSNTGVYTPDVHSTPSVAISAWWGAVVTPLQPRTGMMCRLAGRGEILGPGGRDVTSDGHDSETELRRPSPDRGPRARRGAPHATAPRQRGIEEAAVGTWTQT